MRLLRLYINAYQSHIWNRTVEKAIKKGILVEEVPLVGFGIELGEVEEIIEEILAEERVRLKDFVIKQFPSLSLEGEQRKVLVKVEEFKILDKGKDELNQGKKKIKILFRLRKGSYATVVIKEIFK